MKKAVIILVIIGAIASIGLGIKWISDFNAYKADIASIYDLSEEISNPVLEESLKEIEALRNCAYALIVCGIIAIAALFLVAKIGKQLAAGIILFTGIIPAFFSTSCLIFTFVLILAGILGLVSKPKVSAA